MSSFIDDRWPNRLADDLAVMLAPASDPRRDQHASQGGSLPHLSTLLSPFFPQAGLMPRLLKSNAMLRKLSPSADSLADGVGLSRFQFLANNATLTLGPFA
jgi:hypothetical protein